MTSSLDCNRTSPVSPPSPFLFPAMMLTLPRWGFLNCHPSLLPNYRGPNPWFWQYYQMEQMGGVTIHRLDAGEDTGDILVQESFPIEPGWELARFKAVTARRGAALMVQVLQDLCTGNIHPSAQRHLPCAVRARNIRPDEPLFDWENWPIARAWHMLRGTLDDLHSLPAPQGLLPGMAWQVCIMKNANVWKSRAPSIVTGRDIMPPTAKAKSACAAPGPCNAASPPLAIRRKSRRRNQKHVSSNTFTQ